MANNRMYLVYRPTGDAVFLGKRMGWGWYGTPENLVEHIAALFDKAEEACIRGRSQDDFAIAMESGEGQPYVIDDWKSTKPSGDTWPSLVLDIGEDVPRGTMQSI